MAVDTFELRATIKALEKDRNRTMVVGTVASALILWWYAAIFSTAESLIFGAVCAFGSLIFQEARNSHLQGLRVSLRHIELLRDPNLIREWV